MINRNAQIYYLCTGFRHIVRPLQPLYRDHMWLILAFISAFLLGLYEVFKKVSLTSNAVIPVLFLNVLFCCILFIPVIILSRFFPETIQNSAFYLPEHPLRIHILLTFKAIIVLTSWIFAYFSIKHLPITIASPIKATQPILTLLGAMLIFEERLNAWQWIGVLMAIISFYLLSFSGRKEGIRFSHNKWIYFMVLAIVTGSCSGLYDKYLMTQTDRMTVQVWSYFYQLVIMGGILLILWYPKRKTSTPFQWKNTIPLISLFLILADFVYFYALSYDDSMISIVSLVRRSGVIVSFVAGVIFFKEKNLRAKALDLLLILLGMYFIYLGSQ